MSREAVYAAISIAGHIVIAWIIVAPFVRAVVVITKNVLKNARAEREAMGHE